MIKKNLYRSTAISIMIISIIIVLWCCNNNPPKPPGVAPVADSVSEVVFFYVVNQIFRVLFLKNIQNNSIPLFL